MQNEETIDHIDHTGVIESVDAARHTVHVRINGSDDCAGCPAARLCSAAGDDTNLIEIKAANAADYRKGDIVKIRGTEKMHRKAIIYATVVPCIILAGVLVGVYLLTGRELAAALSGIVAMAIFYIFLWLMRNKIAHEFSFVIIRTRSIGNTPTERE